MKRSLLTLLTLMILAAPALADVPKTMNIQGILTDPAGDPVTDGDYNVNFLFYDSEFATTASFTNDWDITVVDGLFSHVLDMEPWLDLGFFANEVWLGLAIDGEAEQTPRMRLTAMPYAFRAAIADSVVGGSGDGVWESSGSDIYRPNGRVYVGLAPSAAAGDAAEGRGDGPRSPISAKMMVDGFNEGFFSQMTETDAVNDNRFGVYGQRNRQGRNDGTSFNYFSINAGVAGMNVWGDSYTFGVAGHTYFDFEHTAGVMGADNNGNIWGAIAYQDAALDQWGFYTPVNAYFGGTTTTYGLQLPTGAVDGHVLTSDATGNASWQAPSGGGGSDTDWEIVGDDVYHTDGTIYMGVDAPGAKNSSQAEEPRGGYRLPTTSKVTVETSNATGLYSTMTDIDGVTDQRAGLYGHRKRLTRNDGTGFGATEVSGGTLGYTDWGDSYTFGVAGHTWFDYAHTAGVLGANQDGSIWGALAYLDANSLPWGLYTEANAHVGGTLQVPTGAAAGYIMTSDGSGNASWQPPGAANSDSDWTISGDDLIHEAPGVVAIGTASPSPVVTSGQSTLQISAGLWPGIALDRTNSSFNRWALFQEGVTGDFIIGHAGTEGYAPTPQLIMDEEGRVSLGTGTGTSARLAIHGGNGDVDATPGDFHISSNGNASFRVGVHGTGAEAGEVNLRAKTTDDTGRLDIGVDDHDVMVIADYRVSFPNATGTNMVLIESVDGMGDSGGNIKLRSPNSSAPLITLDASPNGDGVIDMNQGELNGIYLDSKGNTYGGGEIKLYNGSGVETLKLDAHHSASGQSRITTASLEITGGADLSEQFDVGENGDQAEPGMVLSIDPKRPGRLAMSDRAYDRRVAGVVSGAGGVNTGMLMGQRGSEADGELPVALAGRVYVWADASEGPIEPGDLLTTADRPGHAMRVKDHQRAGGAILGKAMTGLSEGRGLVLVLVSLQ